MKTLLQVLIIASATTLSACTPNNVQQSQEKIELAYIKAKVYYPVSCKAAEYKQHWYVRCGASGSKTGGIFQIQGQDVYTVNGSARTHAETAGIITAGVARQIDITELNKHF